MHRPGEIIDSATAPGQLRRKRQPPAVTQQQWCAWVRIAWKRSSAAGSTVTSDTDLSSVTTANTQYHFVLTVLDGGGSSGASGCAGEVVSQWPLGGMVDLPYRVSRSQGREQLDRPLDVGGRFRTRTFRSMNSACMTARSRCGEVSASFTAGPDAVFGAAGGGCDDEATIHPQQRCWWTYWPTTAASLCRPPCKS